MTNDALAKFVARANATFPYRFMFDSGRCDEFLQGFVRKVEARFGRDAMPTSDSKPDGIWTYYRNKPDENDSYFVFAFRNELDAIEAKLMIG